MKITSFHHIASRLNFGVDYAARIVSGQSKRTAHPSHDADARRLIESTPHLLGQAKFIAKLAMRPGHPTAGPIGLLP